MDGNLLGDGHIRADYLCEIKQSFIHSAYIEFLTGVYYNLLCSVILFENDGTLQWSITLKTNKYIRKLREKWYPGNIKVLPTDFEINEINLMMFICDDGITNKSGVDLATHCFTLNDVTRYVNLLNQRFCITSKILEVPVDKVKNPNSKFETYYVTRILKDDMARLKSQMPGCFPKAFDYKLTPLTLASSVEHDNLISGYRMSDVKHGYLYSHSTGCGHYCIPCDSYDVGDHHPRYAHKHDVCDKCGLMFNYHHKSCENSSKTADLIKCHACHYYHKRSANCLI